MVSELLDPLRLPLRGSRLIEASAGTGKTWTIAALYLRLVLGHGQEGESFVRPVVPSEILVMTFTRAATRELSERIRHRLTEAARCFRGEAPVPEGDPVLTGLMHAYPAGVQRTQAAWRLAQAADAMDEAAVHTIDAWCQRMLREHAFDSGNLFDETLVVDEEGLRQESARDYWRRSLYPLPAPQLEHALRVWPTVEALDLDVKRLLPRLGSAPSQPAVDLPELLAGLHAQHAQALSALKAGWAERTAVMRAWLDGQTASSANPFNGNKLRPDSYHRWLDALRAWATDDGCISPALKRDDAAWYRLTSAGMRDALKAKAQVDWPDHFEAFDALKAGLAALPDLATPLRWHAAAWVSQRMAQLKRLSGTFGFADMLDRMAAALQGPRAAQFRQRILQQYPVALIDEFQDTSPLQYHIFDLLYRVADNDPGHALFLIGDPKQSIYRFRGADIYSYLSARQATEGRHAALGTNHRSTSALVEAVNRVFDLAEQRQGAGAFAFGQTGRQSLLPFSPVAARGRPESLRTSDGPVPAMTLVLDDMVSSKPQALGRMAGHAAEFVVGLLNDPGAGFDHPERGFARLRPADVAVLVRTGDEAQVIRQALWRRGLSSVYLSDKDSVFDSDQACDLLVWLRAVGSPRDLRLARTAFASDLVGLSLEELLTQAQDDAIWDERLEDLQRLHQVWLRQGVLAMLRQTVHQLGLAERWLSLPDGERRLTNVLHLAELLQAASERARGEQALIRWLAHQIAGQGDVSEERVVRLESDADLVKVVTVHKSKGLEYPVVLMPFAATVRPVRQDEAVVDLADEHSGRQAILRPDEEQIHRADQERLREDLRLMYVALTRPRHALWLGVSLLKDGNKAQCSTLWRSALGYLLGVTPDTPAQAVADLLSAWVMPGQSVLVPLSEAAGVTCVRPRQEEASLREIPAYNARFERDWTIGSFSSMVRDMAGTHAQALPVPASARQEALLDDDHTTAVPLTTHAPDQPWHRFPRGALPGNFLHEQMEWLAAEGFALDEAEGLRQALLRRCERQGWGHLQDDVLQWLDRVVRTPLPPVGVPLNALTTAVPEMEFWLPSEGLPAAVVDQLCQGHLWPGESRPALPERRLRGMLMGFADLVFEQGGRYWVLDYKSTALGHADADYHQAALVGAMLRHRYDVQGSVYLLALHRLLRSRLGAAYDPARQLGGAVFLFLRGMAGPEGGCCVVPAIPALLQGLDRALTGSSGVQA